MRFSWSSAQQSAFETLKECLLTAPVLQLANPSKNLRVVTDASDCVVGGVLLQEGEPTVCHPIIYTSRGLRPAERNYHVTERETLAVVHALRVWRVYLFKPFEREERKRRRREEKEKKVTRAGIEPTAAAPSQPTRLDVSRSDHSAASKETASWRALKLLQTNKLSFIWSPRKSWAGEKLVGLTF